MALGFMADQFDFPPLCETAHNVAVDVIASVLEGKKYSPGKATEWIDAIGNGIVGQLREISPNFKYLVSTVISQKIGAGLHCESAAYWDATTDGSITAKYETDTITCLCTVTGIAI
jgi:hypothetical protein